MKYRYWQIIVGSLILLQTLLGVCLLSDSWAATILTFNNASPQSDYFLLNESRPLTEYYKGADRLGFIEHLDARAIIHRCLEQSSEHEQTIEAWNTSVRDLDSIGDVVASSEGMFSYFALRVPRRDSDMITLLAQPGLYGSNLCAHLKHQGLSKYCRESLDSPVPEWSRFREELRIPVMVCTKSATINKYGFVRKGSLQLVPSEKFRFAGDDDFDFHGGTIISDPVFSIAQFRGEAVYHLIVEGLSRLAPFYQDLIANPAIKIHLTASKMSHFLEFLGFPPERLVTRSILAKSTVMFPEPYQSGSKRAFTLKKLRNMLTSRLLQYYPDMQRDQHIVVIRRSNTRRVTNFDEILESLKHRFPQEKFMVYRDDPSPFVQDSFRMFYEAKMVIGPHGAGLANTLLCKPGTPVIEFLTDEKTLNMCFVGMSSLLGLRHEAFAPFGSTYKGSFNVSIATLIEIAAKHLK